MNPQERERIFPLIQVNSINKDLVSVLEDEIQLLFKYDDAFKTGYSFDELTKYALLSSTTLSWSKTIKLCEKLTGEKQPFPKYTLEDAVSIMFLKPEYPNPLYKFIFSEELMDYTKYLAFSLKTVWEKTRDVEIPIVDSTRSGKSAVENILNYISGQMGHYD